MGIEIDQLPLGTSFSDNHVAPFQDSATRQTLKFTWLSIKNGIKSALSTVATSGSYTDLSNLPTIPAPQAN